jgi:hypothetical protein
MADVVMLYLTPYLKIFLESHSKGILPYQKIYHNNIIVILIVVLLLEVLYTPTQAFEARH